MDMYRASHIILDYLQSLTPKYAHNTDVYMCYYDHMYIVLTMYRASHIILDYLQSLTPKYTHNTRKI